MLKIEEVDEVIEEMRDRIIKDVENEEGKALAEEIKALAELLTVRAKYF